ncbi:MAG: HlyD family efflux transporter periplasmic adaptor subunit, partial [Magnetococcales bacterium]|nr:HlyD family efflux transporter periplasmic adaptor subunit [Magnetococcales bacterium]
MLPMVAMPDPILSEPFQATMGLLLNLQRQLGSATTPEAFGFSAVNEVRFLLNYRQAVLWRRLGFGFEGGIVAVSGQPLVHHEAPCVRWMERVLSQLASRHSRLTTITVGDLSDEVGREWREWLPEHGIWLPLSLPAMEGEKGVERLIGGLFLAREHPWNESEQQLLHHLGLIMAPTWWGLLARRQLWRRMWERRPRRLFWLWVALGLGILALPIPQSVLAPAEATAFKPAVVRAPMDGVVDEFHVTPNQAVRQGQALFNLDVIKLRNRLEVIGKELEVAMTEHRQAMQSALQDSRSKAKLALLRGRIQQKEADLTYTRAQLDRVTVVAPRDGIAVFTDEGDWVGRPVTVGERIILLADPDKVELEIRLPVADAITMKLGTRVEFYSASGVEEVPWDARLRYASYRADLTPSGVLAYTLRAAFSRKDSLPRLGLRGTAKLHGAEVSLFYYLLRRPLTLFGDHLQRFPYQPLVLGSVWTLTDG